MRTTYFNGGKRKMLFRIQLLSRAVIGVFFFQPKGVFFLLLHKNMVLLKKHLAEPLKWSTNNRCLLQQHLDLAL